MPALATKRTVNRNNSFTENFLQVIRSSHLLCIATLVVGFGLCSNLLEVSWKEHIRQLYQSPQEYNRYMNQITSLVGLLAIATAFISRWLFTRFRLQNILYITPIVLFATSSLYFSTLLLPLRNLFPFVQQVDISQLSLTVAAGAIYYVCSMTAKYTLFDTTKEMLLLNLPQSEMLKGKSVIDSMGSRLGKTGSSTLYQLLLITFGSAASHLPIIAAIAILAAATTIFATKRLASIFSEGEERATVAIQSGSTVACS